MALAEPAGLVSRCSLQVRCHGEPAHAYLMRDAFEAPPSCAVRMGQQGVAADLGFAAVSPCPERVVDQLKHGRSVVDEPAHDAGGVVVDVEAHHAAAATGHFSLCLQHGIGDRIGCGCGDQNRVLVTPRNRVYFVEDWATSAQDKSQRPGPRSSRGGSCRPDSLSGTPRQPSFGAAPCYLTGLP